MDDLTPKARALIERSRPALRAQPGDRERIEAALRQRLGAEALPAPERGLDVGHSLRWKLAVGAAVGTALIGAIGFWSLTRDTSSRPEDHSAVSNRDAVSPPPLAASQNDSPPPPSAPPVAVEVGTKSNRGLPARVRTPDAELSVEVSMLARATKSLRAGDGLRAIRTLELLEQRIPNGMLTEERRSAKAQALCMLGRVDEGRVQQAQLEERSPSAARAKAACDEAERSKAAH